MENTQKKWSEIFFDYVQYQPEYDEYYDFYEQCIEGSEHTLALHEYSDKAIPLEACKKIVDLSDGVSSVCLYDERVSDRPADYYIESMESFINELQKEYEND